jgi:hypothetical protein
MDIQGRKVDFHALRHTHGVWLFEYLSARPRISMDNGGQTDGSGALAKAVGARGNNVKNSGI